MTKRFQLKNVSKTMDYTNKSPNSCS